MSTNRPYTLSIAGLDPSAGAGLLSDIKTMEQCHVYGLGVSTGITFQNESQFNGVNWIDYEEIENQLNPLFNKYTIDVVKIGLVQNLITLNYICSYLISRNKNIKIIWDPILSASAGFSFHSNLTENHLLSIAKKCFLITPNLPEYTQLLKFCPSLSAITTILLKGGHANIHHHDKLLLRDEEFIIEGSNKKLNPKHGSGCILSSAIASQLALGANLKEACTQGKRYIEKILNSNNGLLGYHS